MSASSIEIIDKRSAAIEVATQALTPMQELQMQIVRTGDLEKLRELRAIEKEWREDQAREMYFKAKADFKRNPPTITKNKLVDQGAGRARYKHATLDEVVGKIVPALAAVGLEHCWIPTQGSNGQITITCRLSGFGYHEDYAMSAPPDAGPGRNSIQAIASTTTYLERYTLLAATGLAASDTDDDGRAAGAPIQQTPAHEPLESGVVADLLSAIEGAGDLDELKTVYQRALKLADDAHDSAATRELAEAKNKRYRQIAQKAGRQ